LRKNWAQTAAPVLQQLHFQQFTKRRFSQSPIFPQSVARTARLCRDESRHGGHECPRHIHGLLVVLVCVVLLAGCEPWGKPAAPQKEIAEDFQTLFRENCSGCHGEDGRGGPGRILNDGLYLAFIPKASLRKVIEQGRKGTAMPAWARSEGGPLTDEQISILVDGMEKTWAKKVNLRGAALPAYEEGVVKGDVIRGNKLFLRTCFACHAKGGVAGPLKDPAYLALTTKQNLRTSIVVGRPDLGMPDYRVLNRGRPLSEQDIADLVTYIGSLGQMGDTASK
jgi:mono/diheme cytochrome c family protein